MSEPQALTVEVIEAVITFHKADEMEKAAKKLRSTARTTILDALTAGLIQAGDLVAGDKKVKVSVPMSKGKDAEFDQDKAEGFFDFIQDTYPELCPAVTTEQVTTTTVNLEVLFALIKSLKLSKAGLIAKLEACMIPAVTPAAMEPRVKAS